MEITRIEYETSLDALVHLSKALAAYEAKYHMKSEEFFDQYLKGHSDDSVDSIEWANGYRHYVAVRSDLEEQLRHVA